MVCFAQVNIEKEREKKDKPVVGQFLISHSFIRGNANVSQINTAARVDYTKEKIHSFILASYMSSADKDTQLQQEAFGHIRFTYMPGILGADLFTQAEYNPFKSLSLRQLNGAYIRAELTRVGTFSAGVGCMSDYESLSKGDGDGLIARGTSYISYQYKDAFYLANLSGYYQPKLQEWTDYRLTAEASLEIKLNKFLALVEQYTLTYDTRPPLGVLVADQRNTTSIKVSW
tara:strand:+ start:5880 stop:6569 length:690 start_codon:yes stop_codon:yes gene_type:complete